MEKKMCNQEHEVKLDDIEKYRQQMACISCAAFGYWKEGGNIHPDYDTVPLHDVTKLYAKYEAFYVQHEQLVDALRKGRVAIDVLMAQLIEVDPSFKPTQSAAWPALVAIKAALEKVEA
jgi:hypothetical protein